MPEGANSKLPVLAIGLVLAAGLAGFVSIYKNLADRFIRLCVLVLPARWALWLSA
jgi:hypothetical protein